MLGLENSDKNVMVAFLKTLMWENLDVENFDVENIAVD
jgi:hypothetical protein